MEVKILEDIFKNIDKEKKDRIINSALEEFSKNSYDKASTNNIVKNANISKGLLYHYFTSKKELYEYLEAFTINTVIDAINEKIDWNESDIFERIKQIIIVKMEILSYYPYLYSFYLRVFENKSYEEMKKLILEETALELYTKIYSHNIDFSKFRDNTNLEKNMNIIRWTIEKAGEEFWNKIQKTNKDDKTLFDEIVDEIDQYINILKSVFY